MCSEMCIRDRTLARLVGMIPHALFVHGVDETIASVGIFGYYIIRLEQPYRTAWLAHRKYRVVGAVPAFTDNDDPQVIGRNAQLAQQKILGGGVVLAIAPPLCEFEQGHPTIAERLNRIGK